MRRSTQWTYNMVWFSIFFYSYEKKHRFKATTKMICFFIWSSLCSSIHLESNTIIFSILWFFYDLLWFFKTILGDNLISFEKFRGWYRPFHKLEVMYSTLHRWGGDMIFFEEEPKPSRLPQCRERPSPRLAFPWPLCTQLKHEVH